MNEQWQELKETIIELRDNDGTGTQQEVCKFLANYMDILEKQMNGSENPGKWIPCSERLPEDRRAVLVTAYWHETYQVMMASYYGDGLWWCVPFNNCGEHMQRLKPKAWMPLPKPYDPQKSEDK